MKHRIWELDALRGLCVLGMIAIHFIYDLVDLAGVLHWKLPPAYNFVQEWGGVVFLLISGICVTLGSRSARRGLIVFGCGMIVTAATVYMYLAGLADISIIIYFGVLQCLGLCMLLWPVFRRLPNWALAVLGCVVVVAGLMLQNTTVGHFWLVPLGITYPSFVSSDYFPLLPFFGFFLLGALLGRTLYKNKQSLLPGVNSRALPLAFLQFCGRHSLPIYLLHQPILCGIAYLILFLK